KTRTRTAARAPARAQEQLVQSDYQLCFLDPAGSADRQHRPAASADHSHRAVPHRELDRGGPEAAACPATAQADGGEKTGASGTRDRIRHNKVNRAQGSAGRTPNVARYRSSEGNIRPAM